MRQDVKDSGRGVRWKILRGEREERGRRGEEERRGGKLVFMVVDRVQVM
jgi:hypothetical protein